MLHLKKKLVIQHLTDEELKEQEKQFVLKYTTNDKYIKYYEKEYMIYERLNAMMKLRTGMQDIFLF